MVSAWEMPLPFSAVHLLISRGDLVTSGAWRGVGGFLPGDVEEKRQTVARAARSMAPTTLWIFKRYLEHCDDPSGQSARVQPCSHRPLSSPALLLCINGVPEVHHVTRSTPFGFLWA